VRKLGVIVFLSMLTIIGLIVVAFFYIDFSGHRGSSYGLVVNGTRVGSVTIDRYTTEDKIIYKSITEYPHSDEYPVIHEKLFLQKKGIIPLRFLREAQGTRGRKRETLIECDTGKFDFLFIETPRFISLQEKMENDLMIFSPANLMLYLPIMEKYNFWRKGTQFFDVLIPVDGPIPPIRDRIEIRYLGDAYIPVMGRRHEAENFSISSEILPTARIYLSKYSHRMLTLKVGKTGMKFVLVGLMETPWKRIRFALDEFYMYIRLRMSGVTAAPKKKAASPLNPVTAVAVESPAKKETREILFESGSQTLIGQLHLPKGNGPFPGVLIVPEDGPGTKGEQHFINEIGTWLSDAGYVVLSVDRPSQGKIQGNFNGQNDSARVGDIAAAVAYLERFPTIQKNAISIIGHGGGGYLALKAASKLPEVRSCILLGTPLSADEQSFFNAPSKESILALLYDAEILPLKEDALEAMMEKIKKHMSDVAYSTKKFSYYTGVKVPLTEYREFLMRKPREEIAAFERPVLVIFGKEDKRASAPAIDALKRTLGEKHTNVKIVVWRELGNYVGATQKISSSWKFLPNTEVFKIISDWLESVNSDQ